jgi:phenylalanine-4-hydroxylase
MRRALEFHQQHAHEAYVDGLKKTGISLERVRREHGRIVLLSFSDCRLVRGNDVLFDPAWGTYDMAVGARVVSVFHGAADKDAYEEVPLVPKERTIKVTADEMTRRLESLYQLVRNARETGSGVQALPECYEDVRVNHPRDWLLSLEILEVLQKHSVHAALQRTIRDRLAARAKTEPEKHRLISNGLRLLPPPMARRFEGELR